MIKTVRTWGASQWTENRDILTNNITELENNNTYDCTHNVHFITAVSVFLQELFVVAHETLGFNVMSDLLLLCSTHHPLLQFLHRVCFGALVAILACPWSRVKWQF